MEEKKSRPSILVNLFDTKYEIIHHIVTKVFNWGVTKLEEDESWDVLWTDNAITPDRLSRMKRYQKINHFPGMYAISRKNYLAYNLNKLRKLFPNDYNFFPRTWVLPSDLGEIKSFLIQKKNAYLIVKPEASCQGRGIFLTKRFEDIDQSGKFVIQEYISKPYLIDSLKFDLRIYVLLTGCCPLRLFIYREGLTRFATEPYTKPNSSNSWNTWMHLTNYAVNKNNPNFIQNEDSNKDNVGHKRSLSFTFEYLSEKGVDTDALWSNIEDIIIKTVCSIQPILSHHYRSCQPDDFSNSMCFEILGFDIILDSSLKPYILEVNHTPSFSTDSPLDFTVKKSMISDTMKLLNISPEFRKAHKRKQKLEIARRNITGKTEKISKDLRKIKADQIAAQRDEFEMSNLNGFKKVYPVEGCERFDLFIQAADKFWQELTGTNISRVIEKKDLSKSQVIKKRNLDKCSEALTKLAKPKPIITNPVWPYVIYKNPKKSIEKSSNISCINLYRAIIEKEELLPRVKVKSINVSEVQPIRQPVRSVSKPAEPKLKKISLKEILSLEALDIKLKRIGSFSSIKPKLIN